MEITNETKTEIMKYTFIIIDRLGARQATIKSNDSTSAKLIYTQGLPFFESRTFAVRSNQYNLIK